MQPTASNSSPYLGHSVLANGRELDDPDILFMRVLPLPYPSHASDQMYQWKNHYDARSLPSSLISPILTPVANSRLIQSTASPKQYSFGSLSSLHETLRLYSESSIPKLTGTSGPYRSHSHSIPTNRISSRSDVLGGKLQPSIRRRNVVSWHLLGHPPDPSSRLASAW